MALRIFAVIFILTSVLFWPFWITAILVLAGMAYFDIFWEGVVLLLLSDLLFGAREAKFSSAVFVTFIAGVVAIITVELLKNRLKFYK